MANCARLLNTNTPISDLGTLLDDDGRAANVYLETIGPNYRLPIPWLCCFRPDDMKPVVVQLEDWDGNVEHVTVNLPGTTVENAIGNLAQSLPLIEKIVGDPSLARPYWDDAMAYLRSLPLPYLTLDPLEIITMTRPATDADELIDALGGDDAAIPHLKDNAVWNEGCLPYPLDVLLAPPSGYDEQRMENAASLCACGDTTFTYGLDDAA